MKSNPAMSQRLIGNQFWRLRAKDANGNIIDGKRIFGDANVLIEHAHLYFDWVDRNPRYKTEIIKKGLEWEEVEIALGRPYTMSGLCTYLGVSGSYFRSAKIDLREKVENRAAQQSEVDLLVAIEWIEQIVFNEQIEGAAVGQYNGNIISRLNGLADTVNNTATGDPVLRIEVRDEATAENMQKLRLLA